MRGALFLFLNFQGILSIGAFDVPGSGLNRAAKAILGDLDRVVSPHGPESIVDTRAQSADRIDENWRKTGCF